MIQKSAECELAWVGLKTQKIRNIIAMIAIFFTKESETYIENFIEI